MQISVFRPSSLRWRPSSCPRLSIPTHIYRCKPYTLPRRTHQTRTTCIRNLSTHFLASTTPQALPPSDAQRSTIYALATPAGKGGIAVVRVSGPDVREVYRAVVRRHRKKSGNTSSEEHSGIEDPLPQPRRMERCSFIDPLTSEILDDGLVVYFAPPRSFTSEPTLELHLHSSPAVLSALLSSLSALPGLRPAGPGEFTMRAVKNGRMDLTQAEGVRDLVEARTEAQRRLALGLVRGTARRRFESIRSEIVHCLAMIEALIDFGEGEDIEEGVYESARRRIETLHGSIVKLLADEGRGEIVRSGVRLAIFGPPNAGKSSLLNFLARREAAIVTAVPGTTRDVLELTLDVAGIPVVVADTAGLRVTDDIVERIGVERATEQVKAADATLCVLSLADLLQNPIPRSVEGLMTAKSFVLLNKADLAWNVGLRGLCSALELRYAGVWVVSLTTGEGTAEFVRGLGDALQQRYLSTDGEEPLITNARHRAHLDSARVFLEAFMQTAQSDVVLGAEELRYAARAVGQATGAIDVEEVLDAVFRDFCIGK